jgi:hypothetical protein
VPVAVATYHTDLVQLDEQDNVNNQEIVPITLAEQFLEMGIEYPVRSSPDGRKPPPYLLDYHSGGRPLAECRARQEEVSLDTQIIVTDYVRGPDTQPYREEN